MRAWVIEERAQGNEIAWREVPEPAPGDGELLLAVHAVGLNRADLLRRPGHYERVPTRPVAPIVGLEAAGEVIAVGRGVARFRVGDRVMGMPPGSYAERTVLHERLAMPVPPTLDWAEAAALPVAMLTAHDALVTRGRLASGDVVLVDGASSGVGIAALQIARASGARVVIGTAGSEAKRAALAAYGLTHGIDYRSQDIASAVHEASGGHGADVIVDMVGSATAQAHLDAAAIGARWVQVGRMSGKLAQIDLDVLSRKRVSLIGVTFRTRTLDDFAAVVDACHRDLGEAYAERRIAMPIAERFPLHEADRAQALMRSTEFLGKIVLTAA